MPNALFYGVPYSLFWSLNPRKLEPFQEAKKIEMEIQSKQQDHFAWLQGAYIMQGISSLLDKNANYPSKPYSEEKINETEITDADKFALFVAKHNAKKGR